MNELHKSLDEMPLDKLVKSVEELTDLISQVEMTRVCPGGPPYRATGMRAYADKISKEIYFRFLATDSQVRCDPELAVQVEWVLPGVCIIPPHIHIVSDR